MLASGVDRPTPRIFDSVMCWAVDGRRSVSTPRNEGSESEASAGGDRVIQAVSE